MAELPETLAKFLKTHLMFHLIIDILKNKKMPLAPVITFFTLSKHYSFFK